MIYGIRRLRKEMEHALKIQNLVPREGLFNKFRYATIYDEDEMNFMFFNKPGHIHREWLTQYTHIYFRSRITFWEM